MATETRFLRKNAPKSRPLDYIYDPVFTLCSNKDQMKAITQTFYRTAKRRPIFNLDSMFSTLPHFQSLSYQKLTAITDIKIPRPLYRDKTWKASDFLINGSNVSKFIFRPLSPKSLAVTSPERSLVSEDSCKISSPKLHSFIPQETEMISVKTQTDYRESEAQTDPYSPEYVLQPGCHPELLALASLSFGKGLPPGRAAVEIIEHARAKRAWEKTLPEQDDFDQWSKRIKLMEEMEREEWALREKKIQEIQQTRLEIWERMLQQREHLLQKRKDEKLEYIWEKKQIEAENQLNRINAVYNKKIRHLNEKKKAFKNVKNDICEQYTNYGSTVYAPRPRDGMFLDRNPDSHIVKSNYLNTFTGLQELELMLPPVDPNPGKIETIPRGFCTKYTRKLDKAVALVYDGIKEEARRLYEPPQVPRLLQKLKKAVFRPPTPSAKEYPQEEELKEQAIVFIQKVLKGRFVQVQLLEGRYRRQDLIDELHSVYTLLTTEKAMKEEDKQQIRDLQLKHETNQYVKNTMNEFLSHAEGAAVANLLDFLSKELIRLQEERCVHAFIMLAERQRYLREAEEGGRRQLEERRRAEEDEIFKHVIKVHQITVDSYLEDIIMSTNEQVSDDQTRKEIKEMAEEINNVAYEIETYRTQLDSEEIVADLVHGFLLPEVLKSSAREKVYLRQKKHLLAARELIYGPDLKRKDLFDRTTEEGEVLRQKMLLEIQARKALKWNNEIVSAKACTNLIQYTTPSDIKIYSKNGALKKSHSKQSLFETVKETSVKKFLSANVNAQLRDDVVQNLEYLHKMTRAAKEEITVPFQELSATDKMLTAAAKEEITVPFQELSATDEMLTAVILPLEESKDELSKEIIDKDIESL